MIPLVPFAAGLVAGGLIVRLLRDERAQAGMKKAQHNLRAATDSGLAMLKTSSATVKRMLWSEGGGGTDEVPTAPKKKTAPRRKKPPVMETGTDPGAPAAARKAKPRKRAAKAAQPPAAVQDTQA